ncbi:hypothetical protein [Oceanibacterium hippocampi]|nr:hypothetical protein [Oceanibacterium hippocampi]
MSDDREIRALARRFLDLWERETAALGDDPTLQRFTGELMRLAGTRLGPGNHDVSRNSDTPGSVTASAEADDGKTGR